MRQFIVDALILSAWAKPPWRLKLPGISAGLFLLAGFILLAAAGDGRADDVPSGGGCFFPLMAGYFLFKGGRDFAKQVVFDIAFTPDGNAWLAADDGLRRFDGFTWNLFGTNNGLPSSFTRAVCVDNRGRLWVGSDAGAGIWDFERQKYDPHGSQTGLANRNVREIDQDPDGTLWFSCDEWPETTTQLGGLTCLKPVSGQWKRFAKPMAFRWTTSSAISAIRPAGNLY